VKVLFSCYLDHGIDQYAHELVTLGYFIYTTSLNQIPRCSQELRVYCNRCTLARKLQSSLIWRLDL